MATQQMQEERISSPPINTASFSRRSVQSLLILFSAFLILRIVVDLGAVRSSRAQLMSISRSSESWSRPSNNHHPQSLGKCAILFYGLPRNFRGYSLPSIVQNIIKPNRRHLCDYYVHYYVKDFEIMDRNADFGRNGSINSMEILLLEQEVARYHHQENADAMTNRMPLVRFMGQSEDNFYSLYNDSLHLIMNSHWHDGPFKGSAKYMPSSLHTSKLTNQSLENIIKMWNSLERVWGLMEGQLLQSYPWYFVADNHTNNSDPSGHSTPPAYQRVALLRSDVIYVTPIDLFQHPRNKEGKIIPKSASSYQYAVVPAFAQYPVNDRYFCGPYHAARIWATGRFERLEKYLAGLRPDEKHPYPGIHSEHFLEGAIWPAIQNTGTKIIQDAFICFLRVRADGSIRIGDCGLDHYIPENSMVVESILGYQKACSLFINHAFPDEPMLLCQDINESPALESPVLESPVLKWKHVFSSGKSKLLHTSRLS